VLIVDRSERDDLAPDPFQPLEQELGLRKVRGRSRPRRGDRVHQVTVAEELGVSAAAGLLQAPELEEAEGERHVVAEVAEIADRASGLRHGAGPKTRFP